MSPTGANESLGTVEQLIYDGGRSDGLVVGYFGACQ